jgi:hypothetical protein
MGTTFRYIADAALRGMDEGECHHCGRTVSPLFYYSGVIVDPNLSSDPDLAREEPRVDEACGPCILSGNLRKDAYIVGIATRQLRQFGADVPSMLEGLHRTPEVPLFLQGFDWPVCCGEWCEFTGTPQSYEESVQVPPTRTLWRYGPATWDYGFDLEPESLREVSLFRCLRCPNLYFVWQCT